MAADLSRFLIKTFLLFVQVVTILALAACSPEGTEDTSVWPAYEAAKRLPLEICNREGVTEPLLCGELEVYENRAAGTGRKISVSVVVIPAQNGNPQARAWIEHQGGPRYSMIAAAYYYAKGGELEYFRRNRDIVLIDPRGLHEANPLYCDALKYPRILERYYPPDRVRACREELEQDIDLSQYSTLNAIDDFEDIREWLGYGQWDAGGWSFGSRYMLTYLHRYPESIRTMTLSFPAIMNFQRPLDYARFGQQGFDKLVEDCLSDSACAERFPDPKQDMLNVLAALEEQPVVVEILNPYSGQLEGRTITRDVFAESIWVSLLWNSEAVQVPFILRRAAEGDFTPFVEMNAPAEPQASEPEGHYFSVVCPEETAFINMQMATEASAGTFVGPYLAMDYIEACDAWGLPRHPELPIEERLFDTPALVFSGARDPVTQPEYGDQITEHFKNVRHIVFKNASHGTGGFENEECYGRIIDDFVEAGSVDNLDISCIADMKPPAFRYE
jgi:pimeloyl-ACP methyl ester carboxylesterase